VPARQILTLPHPLLRAKAEVVQPPFSVVSRVIQDLWDTLDAHVGVGIAAPQIGESLRIIVVDATRSKRPVKNHGRLTLINPVILEREGTISFREGCLSVPDYVAFVERSRVVTVSAIAPDGSPLVITAQGFEAVILQHEIDHLDGILFIDRIRHARDIQLRPR
jgi:peptide deformylase